jgi:hypothetical protein
MSTLNGLKLTNAKRPQSASPMVLRRNKISRQLSEQIELARCMEQGTEYAPTRVRMVRDKTTGERTSVSSAKRVKPWWFTSDTNKVCVQVRYGTRVMELAKGKNSIEVASGTELISALETVKRCVELGELDAHIQLASEAVRERFKK